MVFLWEGPTGEINLSALLSLESFSLLREAEYITGQVISIDGGSHIVGI